MDRSDLEQEAASAAWRGRNVKLHLIDVLRKATRHRCAHTLEFRRLTDDLVDHRCGDPFDIVATREELRELVAGLPRLTALERAAVAVAVNGDPIRRDRSVDNALTRARRKLRDAA